MRQHNIKTLKTDAQTDDLSVGQLRSTQLPDWGRAPKCKGMAINHKGEHGIKCL